MARSTQNTLILVKVETTSGTDAAPSNSADAVLLRASNVSVKIDQRFATRDLVRGFFGADDMLPYTRRGTISFSVDLAGSGTAGTAPQWGDLLQACAFAETVTAGQRVEYTPVSTSLKTATIWGYLDGVLRKFTYCAGTVKLGLSPGNSPTLDFTFTGLVTDPSAASVPAGTFTAWTRPVAVGPTNTSALTLGGTYATGAITGGTTYNFSDFSVDVANDVQDLELVAQETVAVYGRQPKAEFTLDLTAAAEVSLVGSMKAGTTTSLGLVHGTTGGNKVLVFAPVGVITGIEDAPQGNVLLTKASCTLTPSTGNDELRIVAL